VANVRIGVDAEAEYTEALVWYAARSARAADGLEAAFAKSVRDVGEAPDNFPQCDEDPAFRYTMLSGYPFSLIYRVVGDNVHAIALAHHRKRPGYWVGRPLS
jgi:hypothetical protein